jgi:hypothetical protein
VWRGAQGDSAHDSVHALLNAAREAAVRTGGGRLEGLAEEVAAARAAAERVAAAEDAGPTHVRLDARATHASYALEHPRKPAFVLDTNPDGARRAARRARGAPRPAAGGGATGGTESACGKGLRSAHARHLAPPLLLRCALLPSEYDFWVNVGTNVAYKPRVCADKPDAPAYQARRAHRK